MICVTLVCIQERNLTCFSSVKCLGLSNTLTVGFYSDTKTVINVKLCIMVILTELYLFTPLLVTLTIFQGHSSGKQFQLNILCSYPV